MDWKLCAPICVFLLLLISLQCNCEWSVQANKGKNEKGNITWEYIHLGNGNRQKREWIAPPLSLREEEDNRYRNPIAKVHSDIVVKKEVIFYKITGDGVDRPPFNVFIIDARTGYLNVTDARLDRERTPILYLVAHAVTSSGSEVEKPLQMSVRIQDINDNAPVFSQAVFVGSVEERSRANTLVMQITATDADEPNTINSLIAYRILSQSPSDPALFIMNQHTGQVFTMSSSLDREAASGFSLAVGGSDLNGASGGLSGQCGADIQILDVNDNFPQLEFESYSVEILENMIGFSNLRMQVFDADEMYSDNWIAMFEIVSGNDGGWFMIETDSQTNVGVLKVVKALDYEAMKMANLGILVTNRAAFHYSVMSEYHAKLTSINVQVQNEVEAPVFVPSTIYINIPRGLSQEMLLQTILTKVTALSAETGQAANNVVYSMDSTSSKWFVIDSNTGEIKVSYEFVRDGGPETPNGTYTGIIYAQPDDDPNRPGSAVVVVNVGGPGSTPAPGSTETCPVLNTNPQTLCLDSRTIVITSSQNPSLTPHYLTLISQGWNVVQFNATAWTVFARQPVGYQNYSIQATVTDKNNISCPTVFTIPIQACECNYATRTCDASKLTGKSVTLGPAAIGLLILGFLVLLAALLLLPLCVCGAAAAPIFIPVAGGYEGVCHPGVFEGAKPEDVDMTNMLLNSAGQSSEVQTSNFLPVGGAAGSTTGGIGGMSGIGGISGISGIGGTGRDGFTTGFEVNKLVTEGQRQYGIDGDFNGSVMGPLPPYVKSSQVNMAYVENYFADKAEAFANEDESRPANDCLLIYDNEGVGSPAGSVGCCSFIADELDEAFLDTLGPKFKTLAEICIGTEILAMSSVDEPRSFASIPIVETDTNVIVDESTSTVHGNRSVPLNSSTYVSESSFSSTNLQPVRHVPEPIVSENVLVTETYTTSANPMIPVVRIEPAAPTSILVTERVVGSTSAPHSMFTDISEGSNVIVTERVVRPASGVQEFIELSSMPGLVDTSNVVLRERVVQPNTSRLSNSFNFPDIGDGQNVVVTERLIQPISNVTERVMQPISNVTERVIQPISNVTERVIQPISNVTERLIQPISSAQGGLTIRPDMGSSQNIYVTEKTVRSGPVATTQMLSAEPLLTQGLTSTSPRLTRSKVTKYSTVQYAKK